MICVWILDTPSWAPSLNCMKCFLMCEMEVITLLGRNLFFKTPGTLQAPSGGCDWKLVPRPHSSQVAALRTGLGLLSAKPPFFPLHCIVSLCKCPDLCDTKFLSNTFEGIQIQDSSELPVLYSPCSTVTKFISPVTSKSFPSYSGA